MQYSIPQCTKNSITLEELKIKLKGLGSIHCTFLLHQLKRKILNPNECLLSEIYLSSSGEHMQRQFSQNLKTYIVQLIIFLCTTKG